MYWVDDNWALYAIYMGDRIGVEQDLAILQEFLIPGVLWGFLDCIHFPEITNSRSSWNEPVS